MPVKLRRITALLLLSGYLFSITAALAIHRHADPISSRCACEEDGHNHEDYGGEDHDVPSRHHPGFPGSQGPALGALVHSADHECPICHFHAQKLTATPRIEVSAWTDLRQAAVQPRPVRPFDLPLPVQRSRAPPTVA